MLFFAFLKDAAAELPLIGGSGYGSRLRPAKKIGSRHRFRSRLKNAAPSGSGSSSDSVTLVIGFCLKCFASSKAKFRITFYAHSPLLLGRNRRGEVIGN